MERDSFIFYRSYAEALQELSDKQRLSVMDAIVAFALRGEEIQLKGIEKAIFTLIKPQLVANNQRYENGSKGGRPKKTETKPKVIENENQRFENAKTETKPNVNVNENVNENENVITNQPTAHAREETENPSLKDFLAEYPNVIVDTAQVYGVDFELLREKFLQSKHYLSDPENPVSMKWIVSNYQLIIRDKYKDKAIPRGKNIGELSDEPTEEAERERLWNERYGETAGT